MVPGTKVNAYSPPLFAQFLNLRTFFEAEMARTLVALIKAIIFIGIITGVKSLQCKAALTKGICPCSLSSDRKGIDCDSAPPPVTTTLPPGRVLHYLSTKAGERFQAINSEFTLEPSTKANINVKFTGEEHQRLKGFGGAFVYIARFYIGLLTPFRQMLLP